MRRILGTVAAMTRLSALATLTALAAPAYASKAGADEKTLHDYVLTTAKMEKLIDAGQRMHDAAKKDKAFASPLPPDTKTIDESVKQVEKTPSMAPVLKGAGLSARDFIVGSRVFAVSAIWAAMRRETANAKPPPEVNPANLTFLDKHPDLVERFGKIWADQAQDDGDEDGK